MNQWGAYRVIVTREADVWLADVPVLRGAHTYARNLRSLQRYVREVVVLAADLPDGSEDLVDLDWTYDTGDEEINRVTGELRTRRTEIDEALQDLSARTTAVARKLVGRGWSVRDVATLLNVSPQRVSQLTSAGRAAPTRATAKKSAAARGARLRSRRPVRNQTHTRHAS
jgi:DNA-directed RNA polymerase specialized sigma24 family protein